VWNVIAEVIPVIIGRTRTISQSLRQYLSNIHGKQEIKEIKRIAVLGTENIPRTVLLLKYKTYFTGEITVHVAQIVNTEQLQHYIPKKCGL
jgi:hypothetical protein